MLKVLNIAVSTVSDAHGTSRSVNSWSVSDYYPTRTVLWGSYMTWMRPDEDEEWRIVLQNFYLVPC